MRAETVKEERYQGTRDVCVPCGKVAFDSLERAEQAARAISVRTKEEWNAYQGKVCRWYHVGHARIKT